jgi:hypothetical protein
MKATFIFILTVSVAMWSCGSKKQEAGGTASKDIVVKGTSPEETREAPLGSTKADEYTEEQTGTEQDVPKDFEHTFAGYLRKNNGDEILISMYLKAENGAIQGKYFYEANPQKEDIVLKGQLTGDSLSLTEYNPNNKVTGRFHGSFAGYETFEGEWTSPDGKRSLFFKLFLDDMEYEQRKIIGIRADEVEEAL